MPAALLATESIVWPWRRQRSLVRAVRRRIGRGWLVRTGRIGGWYTAIVSGAIAVWLTQRGAGVDGSRLLETGLRWLTVSAALVAVGTAVDIAAVERAEGLDALARQRGHGPAGRQTARFVATVELVTATLLWPGLALAVLLLGLSDAFAEVVARSLRVVAVLVYAPAAGVLLAALARWSVFLAPRRPRTALLALLLVPHAVFVATGEGPSAVRLLLAMLDGIGKLAGGIG
jgi:hypothetical protein